MSRVEVFENRRPVLGINSLGRIGKLTLWHHIGRKYFYPRGLKGNRFFCMLGMLKVAYLFG